MVVRGELDNTVRGRVTGSLWLVGREAPVTLELQGNGGPDLAGCRLTFVNPHPVPNARLAGLATPQTGVVGDMTASRKVYVPDVPPAELDAYLRDGRPVPKKLANCLYLEWYSEASGRVVIESADFQLTLSEHEWVMTAAEAQAQAVANQEALHGFMNRLTQAAQQLEAGIPMDAETLNEFQWERMMQACDKRTDKLMELYDKYRDHPDRDRIVAREMGWDEERFEKNTEEVAAELAAHAPELSEEDFGPLTPNAATEGRDWVRDDHGEPVHPLYLRCYRLSLALHEACKAANLLEHPQRQDAQTLAFETMTAAAKYAGALNGLAYGLETPGFIVARLKRGLAHLHLAINALPLVEQQRLLPDRAAEFRRELFGIREETLRLMDVYRKER